MQEFGCMGPNELVLKQHIDQTTTKKRMNRLGDSYEKPIKMWIYTRVEIIGSRSNSGAGENTMAIYRDTAAWERAQFPRQ